MSAIQSATQVSVTPEITYIFKLLDFLVLFSILLYLPTSDSTVSEDALGSNSGPLRRQMSEAQTTRLEKNILILNKKETYFPFCQRCTAGALRYLREFSKKLECANGMICAQVPYIIVQCACLLNIIF
jgi:hypothetical protein